MKKVFESTLLISLLVFSFFLTDKTSQVIKDMDEIMIMIKQNKSKYETKSISAKIDNNSIIPGLSKRIVNINKSYNSMKEYGKYNPNLYVYDYINPKVSIKDNKDKYINLGLSNKRMVSINFILDDTNYLDEIVTILDRNNIKATFFIDEDFLSNNLDLVYNLIKEGYIIGIKNNYSNYKWMNTIITKVGKKKNIYCLYNNRKTVYKCMSIDGYAIKGITIDNNYYSNIKDNLRSGSIFNLKVNNNLINNLDLIIKFILKKGYSIEEINTHVQECY